jgi:hypothetical protein
VCHNYQKPVNYARYCPQPHVTSIYWCTTDHETKDCLTFSTKIQDKRNQNNQNVQSITVENREEVGNKIKIVTRGGSKTRKYATKKDQDKYQWVRKNTMPEKKFDTCKEKETFKEARSDILKENIASTSGTKPVDDIPVYDMRHLFHQTNKENPIEKVSNLRKKLVYFVKLFMIIHLCMCYKIY